jgi:hypothetical protein
MLRFVAVPFYHLWPFVSDGGQPEPRLVLGGAGPLTSLQNPPPLFYHVWPFVTDGGQPEPWMVPWGAGPLATL